MKRFSTRVLCAVCVALVVCSLPVAALAAPGIWEKSGLGSYQVRLDGPADLSTYKAGDTVRVSYSMRDYSASNVYATAYLIHSNYGGLQPDKAAVVVGPVDQKAAASNAFSFKMPSGLAAGEYRLWLEVYDFGFGKEEGAAVNTRINIAAGSSATPQPTPKPTPQPTPQPSQGQTGWVKDGSGWYYRFSGGGYATGWQQLGSSWYYFNGSGRMLTGWQQLGSSWYYLEGSGKMATGWTSIGGKWYFFKSSGAMATGWQKILGSYYYFSPSGAMKTGWHSSGSSWYYLEGSGKMATGWRTIGGKYYFFNKDTGAMLTGRWLFGSTGERHNFSSSGVWLGYW